MKISDFVMALQVIQSEHGDLDVTTDGADGHCPVMIEGAVEVTEDDTGTRSKVCGLLYINV
jgi:hypothetical protein